MPPAARLRVEQAARSLAMVKVLWHEARRAGPVNAQAREVRPVIRELGPWQAALDRQLAGLEPKQGEERKASKFDEWLAGQEEGT